MKKKYKYKDKCPTCGKPLTFVNWRVDKERDPHKLWCGNQKCKSVEEDVYGSKDGE